MHGGLRQQAEEIVFVGVAEHAQAGGIDEADATFAIDAQHAITDRAEDAVELFATEVCRLAHLDGSGQSAHAGEKQVARFVLEHAFAGPGLQATADDVLAVSAGDDGHQRCRIALAQLAAQLITTAIRQEVVDDGHVVVAGFNQPFGFFDGRGDIHPIALALQHVAVGLAHALGIIDKQDADTVGGIGGRGIEADFLGCQLAYAGRDATELRPQQHLATQGCRIPGADFSRFLVRHEQGCRRIGGIAGVFEQGAELTCHAGRRSDHGEGVRQGIGRRVAQATQVVAGFQVIADLGAHRKLRRRQRASQQMVQGGRALDDQDSAQGSLGFQSANRISPLHFRHGAAAAIRRACPRQRNPRAIRTARDSQCKAARAVHCACRGEAGPSWLRGECRIHYNGGVSKSRMS